MVSDDGAQEAHNAPRQAIEAGPLVMISRPASIGARDATAATQCVERPEQGTVVEDAAAVAW
jgi:hypothetical protein